jgi:hypothetical protein
LKGIGFWVQTRNPNERELDAFCADLRTAADQNAAKKPSKKDLKRCHSAEGVNRSCGSGATTCCSSDNAEFLSCLGLLDRQDVETLEQGFWASPVTWAAGASVTVGSKSYQFLSKSTSINTKETLTPWSAQIFVAEQSGESLFTGGFRYQIAYEDGATGSLCPAAKTYPVQCKTGPIGAPPRTESPIPYLELRHKFSLGFAIDPNVNYDLKKNVVGITLPFYFVGNGNGRLTGGATVGWRSDQGGPQFGLFVGSTFSLSPQ